MSSTLLEMGPAAMQHREQVEEVKRRMNLQTDAYDCWIYNFLENKHYDVEETVAKLHRRDTMERTELANYDVTDYMREQMSKGVIQLIGDDKEGRVTFYIVTNRDFPLSAKREENKRNFDMWLSYGTRLRKENKRCRITMLVNHDGASLMSNTDMTFQSNVALRMAKFYPGSVDRMYICNMNRVLTAVAKPIFSRLPKVISERIFFFSHNDVKNGKLLAYFEADVLPVAMGGQWNMDGPENWRRFAQTIEGHFIKLKAALHAGMNVKEWEQSEVERELKADDVSDSASVAGREEQEQPSSATRRVTMPPNSSNNAAGGNSLLSGNAGRHASLVENDWDDANMRTCDSYDGTDGEELELQAINVSASSENDRLLTTTAAGHPQHHHRRADDRIKAWSDSCTVSILHDVVLLVEQHQRFFRRNIEELETVEFHRLCEYHTRRRGGGDHGADDGDAFREEGDAGAAARIAARYPAAMRSLIRGAIWTLCVIISVYFFAATMFLASIACCVMVLLFYGMFIQPHFIVGMGLGMLVTGVEGVLVCSRGFELVKSSFRGRLLHPLRSFGSSGLIAQSLFFFLIILAQFIVFCAVASTADPLTALRISFATGFITCAFIVALYHVTFAAGSREAASADEVKERPSRNLGALTLYLFINITEDVGLSRSLGSEVAIASIPIFLSFISGLAFMCSGSLFYIIANIVTTMLSALVVSYFTEGDYRDHSSALIRFVTASMCVGWMFIVYEMGFVGWRDPWGYTCILVAIFTSILLFACAVSVVTSKSTCHTVALRLAYFGSFVLTLAGVVILFTVNWALGFFVLLMMVHAMLCMLRSSPTSMTATLVVLFGFVCLMLACVLLGYVGTVANQYTSEQSGGTALANITTYSRAGAQRDPGIVLSHPICLASFAPGLDVVGVALFAELAYAADSELRQEDLAVWFPNYTLIGDIPQPSGASNVFLPVVAFHNNQTNSTVLSFRIAVDDQLLAAEAMTMWIEAMAMAPFSVVIPPDWMSGIIGVMSFTNFLIPFSWRDTLTSLKTSVASFRDAYNETLFLSSSSSSLLITGHGIGGGFAAMVAAEEEIPAVVFGAPGLTYLTTKFGLNSTSLQNLVTPVVSSNGVLSGVGGELNTAQQVSCGTSAMLTCQQMEFFVQALQTVCHT